MMMNVDPAGACRPVGEAVQTFSLYAAVGILPIGHFLSFLSAMPPPPAAVGEVERLKETITSEWRARFGLGASARDGLNLNCDSSSRSEEKWLRQNGRAKKWAAMTVVASCRQVSRAVPCSA